MQADLLWRSSFLGATKGTVGYSHRKLWRVGFRGSAPSALTHSVHRGVIQLDSGCCRGVVVDSGCCIGMALLPVSYGRFDIPHGYPVTMSFGGA